MSDNTAGDRDEVQHEEIPDIDYNDSWEVKQEAGLDYDRQVAIEQKCEALEVGDEVLINNRQRALTVVPFDEVEGLMQMAVGETVFLKGNGTEYRLKFGRDLPSLDRGDFSDQDTLRSSASSPTPTTRSSSSQTAVSTSVRTATAAATKSQNSVRSASRTATCRCRCARFATSTSTRLAESTTSGTRRCSSTVHTAGSGR